MPKAFIDGHHEAPADWAAFADMAPDLGYADWRDEVMSFLDLAPAPALLAWEHPAAA